LALKIAQSSRTVGERERERERERPLEVLSLGLGRKLEQTEGVMGEQDILYSDCLGAHVPCHPELLPCLERVLSKQPERCLSRGGKNNGRLPARIKTEKKQGRHMKM
jgi:hypothetical protein